MHRDLLPSSQLFLLLTCYALLCRHVRKASVQTLTMAAHNKPGLILDHLPKLLPLVYEQTKFNSALVRRVCASAAPTSLRGSAMQVPSSTGAELGHLHSMGRPGRPPKAPARTAMGPSTLPNRALGSQPTALRQLMRACHHFTLQAGLSQIQSGWCNLHAAQNQI